LARRSRNVARKYGRRDGLLSTACHVVFPGDLCRNGPADGPTDHHRHGFHPKTCALSSQRHGHEATRLSEPRRWTDIALRACPYRWAKTTIAPGGVSSPDLTPASEAEGQVVRTRLSPQVTGRRLVSFLVSYMFVYLGPSSSTTGLRAGQIDQHGRSWTVILHPEKTSQELKCQAASLFSRWDQAVDSS
jgi:hypothetical protein